MKLLSKILLKISPSRKEKINIPYGKNPTVPIEDRLQGFIKISDSASLLYLGDSTLIRYSSDDESSMGIDYFLQEISRKSIYPIAGTGYNSELFYGIVKYLILKKHIPNTCILPINLRSFSPLWMLNPSFNQVRVFEELTEEKSIMNLLTKEAFLDEQLNVGGIGLRSVGEYRLLAASNPEISELIRLRAELIFRFHYLFDMDIGNRMIIRLNEALTLLSQAKVKTLVYFTPLNTEAGGNLVGTDFLDSVNERVSWICDGIKHLDSELDINDWTSKCGSDCFFSPFIANEHLNEKGRRQIASLISDRLLIMNREC